jgi:uncharacterized protein YegP (UPF0339 family)
VKIIVYLDKSGDYRWKPEAENDEIIAESAEGYRRKGYATRMAKKVGGARDQGLGGLTLSERASLI